MKRLFLLTLGILIGYFSVLEAQKSYGGLPLSFDNKGLNQDIFHVEINPPDMEKIHSEDISRSKSGCFHRVAVILETDVCISEGTLDELEDGTIIRRLKISAEGAKSLTLLYDDFYIPQGASLYLYNDNKTQVLGAFDHRTNPVKTNRFSTEMVQGETTYVEYIQAPFVVEEPSIKISRVAYNYRNVGSFVSYFSDEKNPDFGASGDCNVNINCPEGDDWQIEKRGVGLIYVISGFSAGFCSGTLINNVLSDGTPYFLSADHCGGDSDDMDQWQFYFHFEADECENPQTEPSYETLIGCQLRARGPEVGGTDFLLVELFATPNEIADINLYYNGWDRTTVASNSGVGIHHPSGDIKKISTYTDQLQTVTYPNGMDDGFWQLTWTETYTDHSVTEQGSSGSPIFDYANKKVIGTLSGGNASCINPTGIDMYGKFYYHWDENGVADNRRLSPWLDPNGTGVNNIEGYDPNEDSTEVPEANFEATPQVVTVGGTVEFTDLSTNNPTEWDWTFEEGDPATSGLPNPSIVYDSVGTWDVTLTVRNSMGEDTEIKTAYITVIEDGDFAGDFTASSTQVEVNEEVNFTDLTIGEPTSWEWNFGGTAADPEESTDQNPSVSWDTPGIYTITLEVSDGSDTDVIVKEDYITVTPPGTGDLIANFIPEEIEVYVGECIDFTDMSYGGPTSWSWSFEGATPITSTFQNPTNICYSTPGNYDVCLQVFKDGQSNAYCCDGCVTVLPDPSTPIANFEANRTVIPAGGVVHFSNLSENGPMIEWAWTFQGGTPFQSNDSLPPAIAYFEVGEYDVELRCKSYTGIQDIKRKEKYITVIPAATGPPSADFHASFTTIQPGDEINFLDYSSGHPYSWYWKFGEDGDNITPSTSDIQNPQNIRFDSEGLYRVKQIVTNNYGSDTLIKEEYIYVSSEDTCVEPPVARFTADNRLIPAGKSVGFIDQSLNNPTGYQWHFGLNNTNQPNPPTSTEASPSQRIKYNQPGIYNVKLTVTNTCGADELTKNKYIYVFSGYVSKYCDTLSNIGPNESVEARITDQLGWGFLAGHNGDNIRSYADRFENHTFSHINGLLVPVVHSKFSSFNSSVRFFVWDGNTDKPENVIADKRVLLSELKEGQMNEIIFDQPVEIDGPFYVGYTITYVNQSGSGMSDDLFVVGIAPPRGNNPDNNTMYVQRAGQWFTMNERFGFSSSLPIRPITCLVDIQEFTEDLNIKLYPNPSTGIVNVDLGDLSNNDATIGVYDLLGRKIIQEEYKSGEGEKSLNIKDQPEGVYIISIKSENYVINKKLLLSK